MTPDPNELLGRLGVTGQVVPSRLAHNGWLTPGIWRVQTPRGPAVLKYLSADRPEGPTAWDAHWTARDTDPRHWNYWAREALVYRDQAFAPYVEAGLKAPGCLAVRVDDRDAVLLIEWVEGVPAESWAVVDYAGTAVALGRAQGRLRAGPYVLEREWLSRGFLRDYSSEKPVDWDALDDDEAWAHPRARECLPSRLREGLSFLHENRERLYAINEALPRTLCHLDFWTKNLFSAPGDDHVLIDWGFAGEGAVGEDIGNLVPDAAFDFFVAAASLGDLERVVFDSYLAGLRSSSWDEDPRLVQVGMWSSAVKYDWLGPATLLGVRSSEQYRYGGAEPIDPVFKFSERGKGLLFICDWARQAVELADRLGI